MPTVTVVANDSVDAYVPVEDLRRTKNAIIGNPTAKSALAANDTMIPLIVDQLDAGGLEDDSATAVRVEAATIVASLAVGSQEALRGLLRAETHKALFYAISELTPSAPTRLKDALTRALRAVGVAVAETVGPSLWQLGPGSYLAREDARVALEEFFHDAALDIYMPLVEDRSVPTANAVCSMLASILRVQSHRTVVSDWLPPKDRAQESSRTKRGWEKPDVKPNAPRRQGGWLARALVRILHEQKDQRLLASALNALAALCKDNPSVAEVFIKVIPPDTHVPFANIMSFAKSRNFEVQLGACLCATNILRAQTPVPLITHNAALESHVLTLLHLLDHMIASPLHAPTVRSKASFILCALVSDDSHYEQLATDCSLLNTVIAAFVSITPTDIEWDEEEAAGSYILREALLTAATALMLHNEASRQRPATNEDFMAALRVSLAHPEVGVRHAACQAVRAVTRSVHMMRTAVVDAGLGPKLFDIVRKPEEDRRVRIASLAAMCNLITTEHSPARAELIERGGIDRLVELVKASDEGMRINAAWAINNCLYKSTYEEKELVMKKLGWDTLNGLIDSRNDEVKEQAISIIKNFAVPASAEHSELEILLEGIGKERLLNCLQYVLSSSNETLLCRGFEMLVTLAKGRSDQDLGFCDPPMLARIRAGLQHPQVLVRRIASKCAAELLLLNTRRMRDFRDANIESTLRHMHGPGHASQHSFHIARVNWQPGMEEDDEVRKNVSDALMRLGHGYRETEDYEMED
ncbi:ARM repeat-containing protein [Auricularia subglabra TFB-10046 SS5]|nr:ARM repeat-containing protein [Auricularia subglabra TFB-10046 SS5]